MLAVREHPDKPLGQLCILAAYSTQWNTRSGRPVAAGVQRGAGLWRHGLS